MSLHITDKLKFPDSIVTEVLAWIGRRGSGKTYGATKAAEEMYRIGAQFVALDSVGVWYGLREPAEGVGSGLAIPIFGGLNGDVPITPSAGSIIADLIVGDALSAIVDTSQFETDADKNRFVFDFVSRLFFKKKASPSAIHIFMEEAQEYAPQNLQKGEEKMLHAVQRMVRLGRNYGIGASILSQRPQDVNKKVLNQAEVVFAFQLTGPQEIDAVRYWCQDKGYADDLRAVLPKLETGHAHLWSPVLLKANREVHIAKKRTAARGTTPSVGIGARKSRALEPIEIESLAKQMAATIEKAKAEDPKELQRQIADRDRRIRELEKAKPTAVSRVDTAAIVQQVTEQVTARAHEFQAKRNAGIMSMLQRAIDPLQKAIEQLSMNGFVAPVVKISNVATARPAPERQLPAPPVRLKSATGPADESLKGGEKAVLIAIAQSGETTTEQIALLTGYKGTSRYEFLRRLTARGFIKKVGKSFGATEAGIVALGSDYQELPTGSELREYWLKKLPGGEAKILKILLDRYPDAMPKQSLGDLTGYKGTSLYEFVRRLCARKLVTSDRSEIAASKDLF